MSRALVTFGTGPFADLLTLSAPGLADYADRHRYQLDTRPPRMTTRPASWGKISRLLDALDEHEEALWVDCDVVVVDGSDDLADQVPPGAWQALVRHRTREGEVPSAGVWYVRREARPALERIWSMIRYLHHRWWEQAALHHTLGYGGTPVRLLHPTDLYWHTHWLDPAWNALRLEHPDRPEPDRVRFVHAGPGSPVHVRDQIMRVTTEGSLSHA